ncbi:MAG TPA: LOG family protein [Candidatus Saccharicenans sp.]|mgnify:FL=1|nr:LOG family protein [Candidatus Saccharicenans sp.]HPU94325.1 LOG family protein [Candidatus Saccharicenans sp.]
MKKNEIRKLELPESPYRDLEFLESLEGRTLRILSEYVWPMARLQKYKVESTILFLGSAKANPGGSDADSPLHKYYWQAEELAYQISKWAMNLKPKGRKYVVCTGGGPGIMEAANRGATRAGAKSIGMNISLPQPQLPNPYITPELNFTFHYFFMRKFWLMYKAKAVIAFPGGFGTLDEFFEIVTLLQTGKVSRKEVLLILYGKQYWDKIINFQALVDMKAISPEDAQLFTVFSSPEETFKFLKRKLPEMGGGGER